MCLHGMSKCTYHQLDDIAWAHSPYLASKIMVRACACMCGGIVQHENHRGGMYMYVSLCLWCSAGLHGVEPRTM